MTRSRYRICDNACPHFMTCTIVGWLPVFTRPEAVQIVFDSWTWLRANRGFEIYGYVILENHLHLIASSLNLAEDMGDFKSFTARQIIDFLEERRARTLLKQLAWHKARHKVDRDHQLWQEGSHPEEIQSTEMMWQKLEYAHNNPVERGYVALPEHWRHSSAANYLGLPGVFPVRTDWQ
ncbi:MAG TPA: transposase [Pirellulaceae bacterium]|nr:transposase [Pirellulaceae bacterium]